MSLLIGLGLLIWQCFVIMRCQRTTTSYPTQYATPETIFFSMVRFPLLIHRLAYIFGRGGGI